MTETQAKVVFQISLVVTYTILVAITIGISLMVGVCHRNFYAKNTFL